MWALSYSACASSWNESWLSSKWVIWEWAEMSDGAPQAEAVVFHTMNMEAMSYLFCLCGWSLRPTMLLVGGAYTGVWILEEITVGCRGGWLPLQIKLCGHAKCSKWGRRWLCSHRITSPLRNFQACWFLFAVQNANGHFQSLIALRKKAYHDTIHRLLRFQDKMILSQGFTLNYIYQKILLPSFTVA